MSAGWADLFPGSVHVDTAGLGQADDLKLWSFAKSNDLVIVSKDEDFNLHSLAMGTPPKVIWLLMGNCSTAEAALRAEFAAITAFERDPSAGTLMIR